jgi:hypothetical protein
MTDPAARPHGRLVRVRDALTPREWARAGATAATIIGLNVVGWGMLAAAVGGHYHITRTEIFGFGTGILAYTLGMRHAFDADHIAAIDNTTGKLVGEGKRPLSTGFFFSVWDLLRLPHRHAPSTRYQQRKGLPRGLGHKAVNLTSVLVATMRDPKVKAPRQANKRAQVPSNPGVGGQPHP